MHPEAAVRSDQLRKAQLGLVAAHRVGVGAWVRVDDEQVNGVGPDVEHSQAHGARLGHRPLLAGCPAQHLALHVDPA